jgi:hypothetical protein
MNSTIKVDKNGWIRPVCPKCSFVMEFNYHQWGCFPSADLNMYCRECHFAVSITPATTDQSINRTPNQFTIYNSPDPEDTMEEEE